METMKTPHQTIMCAAVIGSFIIFTGCASKPSTPTLYQWGSYQGQIYNLYNDPGKVPI